MINLTIDALHLMTKEDAEALRAVANVYHPTMRNENMDVGTLRQAIQRGNLGALATLAELNDAAARDTTKVQSRPLDISGLSNVSTTLASIGYTGGTVSREGDQVSTSFTTRLYKWSDGVPTVPTGSSMYSVRTGVNSEYDGVDGWSTSVPQAPGAGFTLYEACVNKVLHGGALVVKIDYQDASIVAAAYKCASLSQLGDRDVGSLHAATGTISTMTPALPDLAEQFKKSVERTAGREVKATYTPPGTLHPDDNPATGAPDQHALADQVFSGGGLPTNETVEPDPTKVFSGGGLGEQVANGPGADVAAAVFSGGGLPNVQSGTPIPPPLPLVTPQTSPQPSLAATNGSLPPPPPPALVPAAAPGAVATTSPAPNSVELDSTGLPWDHRIHASTKTKTAKGVWTRRRGIEDSLVAEVEAQLRAAMAIPAPPPPPVKHAAEVHGVHGGDGATLQQQQAAASEPAAAFGTLMTFITERVANKRLTPEQVQAAVQTVGLESINLVMARQDLIPQILTELKKVAP